MVQGLSTQSMCVVGKKSLRERGDNEREEVTISVSD